MATATKAVKSKGAVKGKSNGKRGSKAQGKKLTVKQQKLVEGIIEGKTQKEAAIAAGYSVKCASAIATQELNKPFIRETLQELMEQHGLDDASLIRRHKQLLDDDSGSTATKALEMAYKLRGAFVEKHEHSGTVVINKIAIEVVS